jgi:hypothetical protein
VAKDRGEVTWGDIAPDLQATTDHFTFRRAAGFNHGNTMLRARFHGRSMYDYLRTQWNQPSAKGSPYHYFDGVLRPTRVDEDGNVVYAYDETRT